jgi:hypothetical protein
VKRCIKILFISAIFLTILSVIGKAITIYQSISPIIRITQNAKVLRIENNNVHISLSAEVENQSIFPLSIISSRFSLYDKNKQLGYITLQNYDNIKANSTSIMKFQIVIPLEKINSAKNIDKKSMYLQMQGVCDVKVLGFIKKVHINQAFNLSFESIFEEYIFRVFQSSVSAFKAKYNHQSKQRTIILPINIENKLGTRIDILSIDSKLSVNKIQRASSLQNTNIILLNNASTESITIIYKLENTEEMRFSNPLLAENKNTFSALLNFKVKFFDNLYPISIEIIGEIE